jgi:hypothetical protein
MAAASCSCALVLLVDHEGERSTLQSMLAVFQASSITWSWQADGGMIIDS